MDKLKELLKWLSEANENQINGLYEFLINEDIYYIDYVIDEDIYKEFIKGIKKEAIEEYEEEQ